MGGAPPPPPGFAPQGGKNAKKTGVFSGVARPPKNSVFDGIPPRMPGAAWPAGGWGGYQAQLPLGRRPWLETGGRDSRWIPGRAASEVQGDSLP